MALILALVLGVPSARGETGSEPRFESVVLGIAQDGGLPHLGCEKNCCTEARVSGRVEHPACLGVRDLATGQLLLLDATPAVEAQVARLHHDFGVSGRGRRPLDAILLTHAHIGHYLGLAQLGREVMAAESLAVHVSPRMAGFLRENGPWDQLVSLGQIVLHEHPAETAFEPWPGLSVIPIAVPHRDEYSDTMAYKLLGPAGAVLFVPDVDGWDRHPGLLERLLEGVTVAYVDATFYDGSELPGRDLTKIPHPMMTRTMDLLADRVRREPGSVRFIHLNHTNPALTDPSVAAEVVRRGFAIAVAGERVRF